MTSNTSNRHSPLAELRRQAGFHKTMYRQHEERHQQKQSEKLAHIAEIEKRIVELEAEQNVNRLDDPEYMEGLIARFEAIEAAQ